MNEDSGIPPLPPLKMWAWKYSLHALIMGTLYGFGLVGISVLVQTTKGYGNFLAFWVVSFLGSLVIGGSIGVVAWWACYGLVRIARLFVSRSTVMMWLAIGATATLSAFSLIMLELTGQPGLVRVFFLMLLAVYSGLAAGYLVVQTRKITP